MMVVMSFGMLIGMGQGSRFLSIWGAEILNVLRRFWELACFLMITIGIMVSFLGLAIKGPMLNLFGATEQTLGYADDYLNIILWGVVFQVVGFSLTILYVLRVTPK
jgi:Na+-driven multidrug efflux pump